MSHKKQHFIPQSYLAAWCDPETPEDHEPYVWRFSKDGRVVQNKAPKNIFWENNMYTIQRSDGHGDLVLEHGLSELESSFVKIRREKLANRLELSIKEKLLVQVFVAAMQTRTTLQRDHFKNQWGNVLELANDLAGNMAKASPEDRKIISSTQPISSSRNISFTHEEVSKLAKEPLQEMLLPMIVTQTTHFALMHMAILGTSLKPGFITSDAPCVLFDPQANKRPPLYQVPGLMYKTIEITFPISPEQLIVISWHHDYEGYKQVDDELFIDNINHRTRFHCGEYFVVNQNLKKGIWFDSGRPPADSS
jgi:hypothetical protein